MSIDPASTPVEPNPSATARRKFGLADLMILTAAPLLFLLATKDLGRWLAYDFPTRTRIALWPVQLTPLLLVGSLTLVAWRLVPPRPRFAELLRQPGFAANWAIVVFTAFQAMHWLADGARANLGSSGAFSRGFYSLAAWCGGGIALGAWLTLALAGSWRPGRDWFDRVGRAWGGLWIFILAYDYAMAWLRFS